MTPSAELRLFAAAALSSLVAAGAAYAAPPHVLTDLREGVAQAASTGKPLFVLVGQDWCPHTRKVRDDYVGADAGVQAALDGYVVVELAGAPSTHLVGELGTGAYPTLLVYSKSGRELWRAVGEPARDELVTDLKVAAQLDRGADVKLRSVTGAASVAGDPGPSVQGQASADGASDDDTATSIEAGDGQTVTLGIDGGRLSLADAALTPVALTTASGETVRFVASDEHVLKAVSSDGYVAEAAYRDFAGSSQSRIELVATRPASKDELAAAGLPAKAAGTTTAPDDLRQVSFAYDNVGNLTGLKDSAGYGFQLSYPASAGSDAPIERLSETPAGWTLAFTYAVQNKPATIEVVSADGHPAGTLRMTYDASGEMTNVAVIGPDGKPAKVGTQLSGDIAKTFADLLASIRAADGAAMRQRHLYY